MNPLARMRPAVDENWEMHIPTQTKRGSNRASDRGGTLRHTSRASAQESHQLTQSASPSAASSEL